MRYLNNFTDFGVNLFFFLLVLQAGQSFQLLSETSTALWWIDKNFLILYLSVSEFFHPHCRVDMLICF